MLLVPVSSYEDMHEINVLFRKRKSDFELKPHNMLIYDTQLKNVTDLNNYKILSYFHKSVKLISDIFEDQGEGVVMVKHLIIWYLWKALNVLCTGHPDIKLWHVQSQRNN